MRRHTDDLGAVFSVWGEESAVDDFMLSGSWHELRDAPDEGLRREVQDAAAVAEGASERACKNARKTPQQ